MENITKCTDHDKEIIIFCKDCNSLMCKKCIPIHADKGCKCILDIETYCEKFFLPKCKSEIENLERNKETIKDSIRNFTTLSENVMKKIIKLRIIVQQLLETLDSCINLIKIEEESHHSLFKTYQSKIFNEYEELKTFIKNDNTPHLIKAINLDSVNSQIAIGDGEKLLVESLKNSLSTIMEEKKLELLNESLKEFLAKHQSLKLLNYNEIDNKYIYGICGPEGDRKILCKYNVESKKLTRTINVPQDCTISQIGRHVFVSGGSNPIINTLSEFMENTETLVPKEGMKYAKFAHSIESISNDEFITVGDI